LKTLEQNRIALYLQVLDLQDILEAERRRAGRVISELEAAKVGRLKALKK